MVKSKHEFKQRARHGTGTYFGFNAQFELAYWIDRLMPRRGEKMVLACTSVYYGKKLQEQKENVKPYLRIMLGREVTEKDHREHFFVFGKFMFQRARFIHGWRPRIRLDSPRAEAFMEFARSPEQGLFGTFHVGQSDLVGFYLAELGKPLTMVRMKLENAADVRALERAYAGQVRLLWTEDPFEIPLKLKEAVDRGDSVAMQCDRVEHSSRTEAFRFMGARRHFPFTLYHLAWLFSRPTVLAIAMPDGRQDTRIIPTDVLRPESFETKQDFLAAAREHFQGFLDVLERELREQPFQWFNFVPFNPIAEEGNEVDEPSLAEAEKQ